jgi:hypothetical protein
MTRRGNVRAALAAVIGLGVAAGLARAQAPGPACSPEPLAVIEYGGGAPPPAAAPEVGFTKKGPVRDWAHDCFHKIGVGCWSHHNMYTCSSFHSEFTFVFGSCRQFFGEPCLPGPPQPPMPPGYGPPPTYLPQPGYGMTGNPAYGMGVNPNYGKAGCPTCQ